MLPVATPQMILRAACGRRLCGTSRMEDALYLECGLGPGGGQIEDFLCDYPYVLPPDSVFPVPKQGVRIFEHQGLWHVLDWVGEVHYPDPTVFVEEVRALGLSRRLPRNTPGIEKLGPGSLWMGVHPRGWVNEWQQWLNLGVPKSYPAWKCPKGFAAHAPGATVVGCCAGIWWENFLGLPQNGVTISLGPFPALPDGRRAVVVTLPCGHSYPARRAPQAWDGKITYSRAIIARLPITCIAGVQASPGLLDVARKSGLPVVSDEQ